MKNFFDEVIPNDPRSQPWPEEVVLRSNQLRMFLAENLFEGRPSQDVYTDVYKYFLWAGAP